jgi:hypothetical protein
MKNFAKLCTPAKIYFAIAVIGTIILLFRGASIMVAFWKMLFAFIWTYILGWLCKKGFTSISWLLVLLPYIIILLGMFRIFNLTREQKQMMKSAGLQDAYGMEGMQVQPAVCTTPTCGSKPRKEGYQSAVCTGRGASCNPRREGYQSAVCTSPTCGSKPRREGFWTFLM